MFGNAQVGALRVSLGLDNAQFLQGSKQAQTAFKGLQNGMQQTARSAGQARASMANLGQQVGDIAQGLGSGIRPMQIFAQQAGQVAFAMSGLGGVVGRVGTFLSGPFGAALLGVTVILGSLTAAFFDDTEAVKEAEKALKKKKTITELLVEAQEDLNRITGLGVLSEEQQIKNIVATTGARMNEAIATVAATKALIAKNAETQKAIVAASALGNSDPDAAMAAFGVTGLFGESLKRQFADQDRIVQQAVNTFQGAFKQLEAFQAGQRVAAAMDPAVAATQRFETESAKLYEQLQQNKITVRQYEAQLLSLEKTKAAAIEAAKKNRKKEYDLEGEIATLLLKPRDPITLTKQSKDVAEWWANFRGETKTVEESLTGITKHLEKINVPDFSSGLNNGLKAASEFGENLSRNLGQAIVFGQSLGDALVNSIKAAAAELITSGLMNILLGKKDVRGDRGGGLIGGLFGAIGIPGFANGTNNAPGGLAMVGERGRELVRLPKGSQVLPNPDTERLMRGGGQERVVVDVQPSPLFVTTVRRTTQEAASATVNAAMRGNRRMKLAGAV